MKKILITNYNNFILTCLEEEDSFYEMNLSNPKEAILGNIYVGRVEKKMKNIRSFFISYGPNKTAFLSEEDCENPIILNSSSNKGKIVEGTLILIQITKEAVKTKDPTVTTNITLQGKYCIVDCAINKIRFSSKINKKNRLRIKNKIILDINSNYGTLIRTQANTLQETSYHKITEELISLYHKMDVILSNAKAPLLCLCDGPCP